MDLIDLNGNILFICESIYKRNILDKLNNTNKLFNIKFMTLKELVKSYYFNYDEKTIYYLMDKYNIKYDIAETYIENMYYIENINYESEKLNKLVSYKKELEDNSLLIKDNLFINLLKNKIIIFYNYDLTKFDLKLIEELKKITNVSIINKQYNTYEHKVYKFNTINEEVEYVAYKIADLINTGIDINNIKLANISNDYYPTIKRIFNFYNLPINLESTISLYSTYIGKLFIDNYNENINVTLDSLKQYEGNEIYNAIIDICNKYTWTNNYNKIKELIIHDLKNTKVKTNKYDNAIELIDYKNNNIKDEYVFLMNFNLGYIPKVYKDEDYITDSIKPSILESTIEKNRLEKDITIKSINNIKNLVITYKLKTPSKEYYPSNLLDLYEEVTDNINLTKSYSKINDQIKLTTALDKLVKYGTKSNELNILFNNYKIPYLEYTNTFTNINKNDLYKFVNNKLNLSYTDMQKYNECPFKYYLSKVLKLDIYEDNFAAVLGTIFHHVLENCFKDNLNIDEEINICLNKNYKDKVLTNMEKFFIEKIKKDMVFVIDTIKHQYSLSKLDKLLTEKTVYINKGNNIKITFVGKIDKILYKENNQNTVVAIIDYKTSDPDIELGYVPYGLHMQLPIYMYLAKNMDFQNVEIAGIYLQKVLPKIEKIDYKKSNEEIKINNLKLEGYSNSDQTILEQLDITYKDSEVIKSMKLKKDGDFMSYSKVLNKNQIDTLINLTQNEIDKCIENIEQARFDIKPIQEEKDKSVTACKYCKFIDICFRQNKDINKLQKYEKLSFLGGEENDEMD